MKVFCLRWHRYQANILIPGNQYAINYWYTSTSAHFKKQSNFVSVYYKYHTVFKNCVPPVSNIHIAFGYVTSQAIALVIPRMLNFQFWRESSSPFQPSDCIQPLSSVLVLHNLSCIVLVLQRCMQWNEIFGEQKRCTSVSVMG